MIHDNEVKLVEQKRVEKMENAILIVCTQTLTRTQHILYYKYLLHIHIRTGPKIEMSE